MLRGRQFHYIERKAADGSADAEVSLSVRLSKFGPPMRYALLLFAWAIFAVSCPAETFETDVCVYGGTAGGVAAAVQAARMGKTVVLLEFGRHLGGMTSGGLGATD